MITQEQLASFVRGTVGEFVVPTLNKEQGDYDYSPGRIRHVLRCIVTRLGHSAQSVYEKYVSSNGEYVYYLDYMPGSDILGIKSGEGLTIFTHDDIFMDNHEDDEDFDDDYDDDY